LDRSLGVGDGDPGKNLCAASVRDNRVVVEVPTVRNSGRELPPAIRRKETIDRSPASIRHASGDVPDSVAFKKQNLADHRRQCGGSVRLGYQKGWLWPLSGQEALRIGRDENHGHLKCVEEIINGVESRTAVGELNIGQNQSYLAFLPDRKRFRFRPRDADDFVAEVLDQR
jgi:hypothetical protein